MRSHHELCFIYSYFFVLVISVLFFTDLNDFIENAIRWYGNVHQSYRDLTIDFDRLIVLVTKYNCLASFIQIVKALILHTNT